MKVQFFCAMDGSVMRWRSIEWRRCTYMKMLCQWLGPWPRTDLCQAVLLGQLAKELSHTLGFSKEKDFHLQSMPLVALTDPSNPFGSKQMLSWAAVFYFLALLTLLAFQLEFRGSNDYELLSTKSPETDTET